MPNYNRNFTEKYFEDFDLEDIVYAHLVGHDVMSKDHVIRSTLREMKGSMQHAHTNIATKNFVPLLCAFSILDQLADCYKYNDKPDHPINPSNNKEYAGVLRALYYFLDVPALSKEAHALYALRNAMMHDAAFVGKNLKGDWYFFRYDHDMQSLINTAATSWDGDASTISEKTTTLVNPRRLTDQISAALDKLFRTFIENRSNVKELQSSSDIRHKFLAWSRKA
ncbi:hypothetical protein [Agrobacterium rosae]